MIVFLKGILSLKTPTWIEIDVGGVGYGLTIPLSTYDRLPEVGHEVRLSTYLHVREDILSLYGFSKSAERELFMLLITVSGIGPKVATAILSALNEEEIEKSILSEDIRTLCSVPGVGKKTAERMILDLRDKMRKRAHAHDPAQPHLGASREIQDMAEDSISALVTLGYHPVESRKVISQIIKKDPNPQGVEFLIRTALRELNKG
jgi:holliday junction DNA helicase RuvA